LHFQSPDAIRLMPMATVDLVIMSWTTPSECRPRKIASFLGISATIINLAATNLRDVASASETVPRCTCLDVDAETLARAAEAIGELRRLLTLTTELAQHVFVYGFQPGDRHDRVLGTLSSGRIRGVRLLPEPTTFQVSDDRKWCGQFSG